MTYGPVKYLYEIINSIEIMAVLAIMRKNGIFI